MCQLYLRLTPEIDDDLRSRRRYRGDLSRIVDTALEEVNLETVRLIKETPERVRQLIATVSRANDERIRDVAYQRKCTVSMLANSAISRWLSMHEGRI
jgi:hypothetical protein